MFRSNWFSMVFRILFAFLILANVFGYSFAQCQNGSCKGSAVTVVPATPGMFSMSVPTYAVQSALTVKSNSPTVFVVWHPHNGLFARLRNRHFGCK